MRSFILRILQCSDFFLYSLVLVYVLFSGVGLWGFHLWCIFFCFVGLVYVLYVVILRILQCSDFIFLGSGLCFWFFLGGVGGFRVAFACCHGLCILYMRILYILYRPLSS